MSEVVVGHYRYEYLRPTETFIHEIVRRHQRYSAVVLTHGQRNEEQFPADGSVRLLRGPGGRRVTSFLTRSKRLGVASRRWALKNGLIEVRPNVVHAHFGRDAAIALPPTTRLGIPLVASFYGVDATHDAELPEWKGLIRSVLEEASLLLAEGPHLRQRLIDLGAPPARTRIQPIPIRLERFPYRAPGDPSQRSVIFLQACRFVEKKGVDLSIRALAGLGQEGLAGNAELWLIGDGPGRTALTRLAEELGLAERIRFLGMRSHEEYSDLLRRADIFIHPSRTASNGDGEGGAPTALLEAQAVGLPVVASLHADIPFVVDREAALLAPEEDVKMLSAHVRHLLEHPEEWDRRARAGRAKVVAQHDPVQLARRLEGLYDEVLGATDGERP